MQFATAGERIELIHRAINRDIFARGHARGRVLSGRGPVAYELRGLLA